LNHLIRNVLIRPGCAVTRCLDHVEDRVHPQILMRVNDGSASCRVSWQTVFIDAATAVKGVWIVINRFVVDYRRPGWTRDYGRRPERAVIRNIVINSGRRGGAAGG